MSEGYFILPRAIMDDEFFSERFTRAQALIDLYALAAYAERTFNIRGNKVTIKRGQVAIAERTLAERWKWSKNTVHKYLKELEESGKIGTQKSHVINVLSVNYYGVVDPQNDPQNDPPINNIIKEKNKKENNKRKSANEIPDYVLPSFAPILTEWMDYKRERGESYKPRGLKACYSKLLSLSGGNADRARAIIEQSMSNNYAGLFQLKIQDNGNTKYFRNSSAANIAAAQEAHIRAITESINQATERNGKVSKFLPFGE